tara:strand:- start:970 stop:1164 length:195 start_codon:yes stop_codon:yes gene_type:complete
MKKVILSPGWVMLVIGVLAVDLPLWRIKKIVYIVLNVTLILLSYVYFLAPRRGIDNFRGNAFIP